MSPEGVAQAWAVLEGVALSPVQGHALVELVNFAMAAAEEGGRE